MIKEISSESARTRFHVLTLNKQFALASRTFSDEVECNQFLPCDIALGDGSDTNKLPVRLFVHLLNCFLYSIFMEQFSTP